METKLSTLIVFLIGALLFFTYDSVSQSSALEHRCGHDIYMHQLELQDPGFKERVNNVFAEAKLRSAGKRNNQEVYKIRVVVHVVWKEAEENIHDSLILSQIATLNEDFRLRNPDRIEMRKRYVNRQGDSRIEFELAEIRRVQTNSTFTPFLITVPDEVKRSSQGGSDAADPELFMNIWVCKIQPIPFFGGQIFGYAYPPAGLPNWPDGASASSPEIDGVVVDFRTVGKNTPFRFQIPDAGDVSMNGRTITHEVGHYLGLRHIWGDGGGLFGGNSCGADDGVDDTPNSSQSQFFACDKSINTCTEGADADEPDMIENFMDYSSHFCMNSFTWGQIDIMRGVLEGPRARLLEEITTSVSSVIRDQSIELFPNPASNQITIKTDQVGGLLLIRDLNGRILKTMDVSALGAKELITFDVSDLNEGFYLAQMITSSSNSTKKFSIFR